MVWPSIHAAVYALQLSSDTTTPCQTDEDRTARCHRLSALKLSCRRSTAWMRSALSRRAPARNAYARRAASRRTSAWQGTAQWRYIEKVWRLRLARSRSCSARMQCFDLKCCAHCTEHRMLACKLNAAVRHVSSSASARLRRASACSVCAAERCEFSLVCGPWRRKHA